MVMQSRQFRSSLFAPIVSLLVVALCGPLQAQLPEISVTVDDVAAAPGEQQVEIPVYLSSYTDTIFAFEIWFQLDRPDICVFDVDSTAITDTSYWQCTNGTPPTCTDSIQVTWMDPWDMMHIDTLSSMSGGVSLVGSMIDDWEIVISRSLAGTGFDLKVIAIANTPNPQPGSDGILPGESGLLFSLVVNCLNPPSFVTDRTARIMISNWPGHTGFSDPQGSTIGIVCDSVEDSTCYRCDQWVGDACLSWTQVASPPYDSCAIDTVLQCYLDTTRVMLDNGSITLCGPIVAGDVDDNGIYDISDLTLMSEYALYGTPNLPNPTNGDVNGDCCINWEDINLLLVGGPYTDCGCIDPVWCCCMGLRGNIDYDVTGGDDDIDIADVTFMVGYMFKQGAVPLCIEEANVDGDPAKSIDIADLTRLVNFMFKNGDPPASCGP